VSVFKKVVRESTTVVFRRRFKATMETVQFGGFKYGLNDQQLIENTIVKRINLMNVSKI
jgi:hypothetical protein